MWSPHNCMHTFAVQCCRIGFLSTQHVLCVVPLSVIPRLHGKFSVPSIQDPSQRQQSEEKWICGKQENVKKKTCHTAYNGKLPPEEHKPPCVLASHRLHLTSCHNDVLCCARNNLQVCMTLNHLVETNLSSNDFCRHYIFWRNNEKYHQDGAERKNFGNMTFHPASCNEQNLCIDNCGGKKNTCERCHLLRHIHRKWSPDLYWFQEGYFQITVHYPQHLTVERESWTKWLVGERRGTLLDISLRSWAFMFLKYIFVCRFVMGTIFRHGLIHRFRTYVYLHV